MSYITHHAEKRCQQRGLPPLVVDLLLQFGQSERAGPGAEMHYFDHTGRRRIRSYLGPLARGLGDYLNAYLVVSDDGAIVTAGHRQQRVKRA
jgi:hypothetical protein